MRGKKPNDIHTLRVKQLFTISTTISTDFQLKAIRDFKPPPRIMLPPGEYNVHNIAANMLM